VTDRQRADPSSESFDWPRLTVGALVAGIIAMGAGRAAGSLFKDSDAALLTHLIVALAIAGTAGFTIGAGGAWLDRWHIIRRK
jgi:hypothetical protein